MSDKFVYIDDDGAIQGPFSSADLLGWLAEGFFQPTTMLLPAQEGMSDEENVAAAQKRCSEFKPFATFDFYNKRPGAVPTTATAAAAAEPVPATAVPTPVAVVPTPVTAEPAPVAAEPAAVAAAPVPIAATPAPAAAASVEWFYLDDAGEERGPFPSADMRSWHTAGFFNAQTKVRTATESECRPLGERGASEPTFVSSEPPAAAAAAAASVNIEDEFETDMDQMGDEEGEAAGADDDEAAESDEKAGADAQGDEGMEEKVEGDEDKKQQAAITTSVAPASMRWYYTDPSGIEQGPFTAASMLKWHRVGFFAFNDTPLRREDEDKSVPLSSRLSAPSFYSARLAPAIRKENRWYYLDAKEEEQGPFTEEQMRNWWNAGFLKPTLRVRQVGEAETEFSPIETRDCAFTRAPPAPLLPVPQPYMPAAPYPQHPHQPHYGHAGYGYPQQPPAPHYPNPYAAAPAHPYGYAPPQAAPYAAAAGGYAGYAPYGGYGAAAPPAHRGSHTGEYAQSMAFSGHRGRGRHVVAGGYAGERQPHDPLANYVPTEAVDQWANKRPRH